MNALSVAWKLRMDMLGILAAASPRGGERGSESRRVPKTVRSESKKSDIRALLADPTTADSEPESDRRRIGGTRPDSSR